MHRTLNDPAISPPNLFCNSNHIYLLSHSVGRPLQSVTQHLNDYFIAPWQEGHPWAQWLTSINNFRHALATLFHSAPDLFCPQLNLSGALTKILYSFSFTPSKPVILLSEKDFPSISFVFKKAEKIGYRLRFIPKEADHTDPAIWNNYLKEDVRFVMMTHVHSNTGHRVPLDHIVPIARSRDILSIVDVAQSAGIIPINLEQLQPDILIGSCVKWLCGGPGAGFLWMRQELIPKAEPIDIGWFSHKNPFEFDTHHFEYNNDASRFMGGTPSVAPYIIAEHSIRKLIQIGVENIRKHNAQLSQYIIQATDKKYLITPADETLRGGTLVFNFNAQQKAIVEALKKAGVLFDERPSGLRLSFHIYNTINETNAVLRCFSRHT